MIALDRELVQRFAPAPQRPALTALFNIERDVLDTLRPGLEHTVSHAKLGWWAEELERLVMASPRHPATIALANSAREAARSAPDLRPLAEHASVALACVAFVSREELDLHLRHWAGSVFRELVVSGAALAGIPPADAERFAERAGAAVREIELLFDFESHAWAGRVYTPLEPEHASLWTARPLAIEQRERLNARLRQLDAALESAVTEIPARTRAALTGGIVWARLAQRTAGLALQRSELRGELGRTEPLRRTIRAWRVAVRALQGAA